MDTLTRRKFLQLSGAATVGAVAPMLTLDEIASAASARPLPLGTPILMLKELDHCYSIPLPFLLLKV